MTFYYNKTDENIKYMAGVMAVGHHITPNMLIPPQSERYTITGQCSSDCTKKVITSNSYSFVTMSSRLYI